MAVMKMLGNKLMSVSLLVVALLFLSAAALIWIVPHWTTKDTVDHDVIFQVGTIDAILQAAYDGSYSTGALLSRGDIGIGTLDALDGELIVLDGAAYVVRSDGIAYHVPPSASTPFATVTYFEPDQRIQVTEGENFTALVDKISATLSTRNMFYAVRIDGAFPYVKTRSVPRQEKPYPRLVDIVSHQSVFEFRNVSGTVVGFYTPEFVKGINVPGYHLHFITSDRSAGGHILEISVENVTAVLDMTPGFAMWLPTEGAFSQTNLSEDLTSDLEAVEKGGGSRETKK